MEEELTMEQTFILHRLAEEAKGMSREQLISALIESWEMRFRIKQNFMATTREAGYMFKMEERRPTRQPETEDELAEILGYEPTEEEIANYMRDVWENATMELDMDEIVLSRDE